MWLITFVEVKFFALLIFFVFCCNSFLEISRDRFLVQEVSERSSVTPGILHDFGHVQNYLKIEGDNNSLLR